MPDRMSGNELAKTIRKTHPKFAAVLTPGYSELTVVHANQLTSGSVFLRKPYRHKELVETLQHALDIQEAG
jgi:FixJ family two-component response regulator